MTKAEKMREQFEAWHRSVVNGEPPHEKYNNGDYISPHVQRYWLGWQASREAVVVSCRSLTTTRPAWSAICVNRCVPRSRPRA